MELIVQKRKTRVKIKKIHPSRRALVNEALDESTYSNAKKLSNKMSAKLEMSFVKSFRSLKNSVLTFEKLTPNEVKRKFWFEYLFQASGQGFI